MQLARDPDARLTDHPVGDILEGQPVAGELNVEQAIADLGLTPSEAEFVVRARVDVPDDEVVLVSEWTWLAFDCAPPQPAGLVLEVEVVAVEFTADDPERVEVGYRFSLLEASDQNVWSLRITDDRLDSSTLQAPLEAALAAAHSTSYLPAGARLELQFIVACRWRIVVARGTCGCVRGRFGMHGDPLALSPQPAGPFLPISAVLGPKVGVAGRFG